MVFYISFSLLLTLIEERADSFATNAFHSFLQLTSKNGDPLKLQMRISRYIFTEADWLWTKRFRTTKRSIPGCGLLGGSCLTRPFSPFVISCRILLILEYISWMSWLFLCILFIPLAQLREVISFCAPFFYEPWAAQTDIFELWILWLNV